MTCFELVDQVEAGEYLWFTQCNHTVPLIPTQTNGGGYGTQRKMTQVSAENPRRSGDTNDV